MMVMGYLRSTKAATATSPTAKKKAKKDGRGAAAREDAGLRKSLLEQPAAPAAEGGGPKGNFAVYAGEESRRFVVPTGYLRSQRFGTSWSAPPPSLASRRPAARAVRPG